MFGKIATPPNGTVFILIILVVLALFFGNHYSICTEDIVHLSKKKRQIQFLELGFVLCWPAILPLVDCCQNLEQEPTVVNVQSTPIDNI